MARKDIITSNINKLLGKHPSLANNDKAFVVKYWTEVEGFHSLDENFIANSTSSETLCRLKRRILQEVD